MSNIRVIHTTPTNVAMAAITGSVGGFVYGAYNEYVDNDGAMSEAEYDIFAHSNGVTISVSGVVTIKYEVTYTWSAETEDPGDTVTVTASLGNNPNNAWTSSSAQSSGPFVVAQNSNVVQTVATLDPNAAWQAGFWTVTGSNVFLPFPRFTMNGQMPGQGNLSATMSVIVSPATNQQSYSEDRRG